MKHCICRGLADCAQVLWETLTQCTWQLHYQWHTQTSAPDPVCSKFQLKCFPANIKEMCYVSGSTQGESILLRGPRLSLCSLAAHFHPQVRAPRLSHCNSHRRGSSSCCYGCWIRYGSRQRTHHPHTWSRSEGSMHTSWLIPKTCPWKGTKLLAQLFCLLKTTIFLHGKK